MTQNTAAGEWKTGSQIQLGQNGKRWSRKAVKTIWQIRYALQCGTELLIWELGLLNLSFHYSNRTFAASSSAASEPVVLTAKSRFIFHFNTRKCYRTVQLVFSWKLCSATPWSLFCIGKHHNDIQSPCTRDTESCFWSSNILCSETASWTFLHLSLRWDQSLFLAISLK